MANEIIKVLDALCEKFGIVVDWTGTNIMPYVETIGQHIISYCLWVNIVWLIIWVISLTLLIIIWKRCRKSYDWDDFELILTTIIVGLIMIAPVIGIICCSLDIVKCITFPELVIFNEVKDLLNTIQ